MKKFLGTRLGVILICMLVCMLVCGSFVYGATLTKSLPASGKVVSSNPDLAFFADEACTIPATSVLWADTIQGESTAADPIYVKNIGNKNFSLVTCTYILAPEFGTVTSNLPGGTGFAKGEVKSWVFTYHSLVSSPTTEFPCTLDFNATY